MKDSEPNLKYTSYSPEERCRLLFNELFTTFNHRPEYIKHSISEGYSFEEVSLFLVDIGLDTLNNEEIAMFHH